MEEHDESVIDVPASLIADATNRALLAIAGELTIGELDINGRLAYRAERQRLAHHKQFERAEAAEADLRVTRAELGKAACELAQAEHMRQHYLELVQQRDVQIKNFQNVVEGQRLTILELQRQVDELSVRLESLAHLE